MNDEGFTCPRCGATSHHPMDEREGYCGTCNDWTGPDPFRGMGVERHMFRDSSGAPITLRRWTQLQDDEGYKRVAEDYLIVDDEPLWLSTVWIGLDMSFDYRPGHVPIIFETMTFGHGGNADVQERYATEAAALAGHERILAWLLDNSARRGSAPPGSAGH